MKHEEEAPVVPVEDWVAYVAPFPFPWGTAGSRRIFGVSLSLAHGGRHVVVGSGSPQALPELIQTVPNGSGSIVHVALGELPSRGTGLFRKAFRYYGTWGRRTVTWLEAQPSRPTCVIVYGGGMPYARRLRRWCRANGVPVIADVVEWYLPGQFRGGVVGPSFLSAKWALMREYPQFDGAIVISNYLRARYEAYGIPSIVIPPTLDVSTALQESWEVRDRLQLLYFGTPGRKDSLWELLVAVSTMESEVELLVAGPTPQEIRALNPSGAIPQNVRMLGRLPQDEVAAVVAAADFTVLARQDAPNTRAGFPTKVVESLAAGTPVITNITGDLGAYLQDGRESIVAYDGSAKALRGAITRALATTPQDRLHMRRQAKATAERFDCRTYAAPLVTWLQSLEVGR